MERRSIGKEPGQERSTPFPKDLRGRSDINIVTNSESDCGAETQWNGRLQNEPYSD